MDFSQFLENKSDTTYILHMPYEHPPNMDIVTPILSTDNELDGWKSVITGTVRPAWIKEDQLFELPQSGWVVASRLFNQ